MKQILEVGDRVKLMNAEFIGHFIGVTGVVSWVAEEPNWDGTRTVTFILSEEDRVRVQRAPGFTVTVTDANLKYLKPGKASRAAKVDAKFSKRLENLGDLTMKGTSTAHELELVTALAMTLAALDILDEASEGVKAPLTDIKQAMLEELR